MKYNEFIFGIIFALYLCMMYHGIERGQFCQTERGRGSLVLFEHTKSFTLLRMTKSGVFAFYDPLICGSLKGGEENE